MPEMNHTQSAANAKIIAELFPLSSESAEATPLELSQQQMQTLLQIALATITHFFGPPNRYLGAPHLPSHHAHLVRALHPTARERLRTPDSNSTGGGS